MYLHLGQEVIVKSSSLVGIFDLEKATLSKFTREFLAKATKQKKIINVSYEMPKSVILCETDGKISVYISPISSQTLHKRLHSGWEGNFVTKDNEKKQGGKYGRASL